MISVKKSFINYAVEQTLVDIGGEPMMMLVSEKLHSKYDCNLENSYKTPRYINDVLIDLYGKSSHNIIDKITETLDEFSHTQEIEKFLLQLNEF
ncbi:hypothetical protein NZNM25_01980 [Nitrosopumilus zosterae]|uniref:Uncharacterized protein n=1 Tax=Nitrosopumilus zosterae TaxID=718286 RepID=A0A2S2KPB2_9ARCH|nr:hypothetical protein [Nitrosopumilus zosterae]BDQ31196.1 hypothetical protein NZOSNM25_001307 [Nitrosopumilus zosterae]GBH33407.1 hypothetical protein NZNM25_01980 [Nitrosopumilus zosterae]